jgi:cell division protein FtsB
MTRSAITCMNTKRQRNYLALSVVALSAMLAVSLLAMSGQNTIAQNAMNETDMMNETATGDGEYSGK